MTKLAFTLAFILTLAACRDTPATPRYENPEDFPTAASIQEMQTAIPLTQNAPPPPFDRPVTTFARIDANLNELAGWRYVVVLELNGVFARTPREVTASAQAEVWFNQLASARRVVFSTAGDLFAESEGLQYEAVRLGRDSFLVQQRSCVMNSQVPDTQDQQGDASAAADLGAGALIGGVNLAQPAGRRAVINGQTVYAYQFEPEALTIPAIRLSEGGRQSVTSYEMWISPEAGAVVRFYVNVEVENVNLLDSQLPVSGQVALRYDLYDVGSAANISVPNGC